MALKNEGEEIYRSIGVSPIINASGTMTMYSGSKLRSECVEAMQQAARFMVDIDELNKAAGKIIADITGAEAGFVCNGASGGMVLQAAACMAGSDPAKMSKLPDTSTLKNEIIIHKAHRFVYDQCYRATGAKLIEIGDGRRTYRWELEDAFTDRTAAVSYLFSPFLSQRAIPLEQVCEIAHARDVPVIVDAASFLPPRANLRRFIAEGADMVVFSGGKGVRGPQSTGILCGRADLIEAASANASPNAFIGRSMKVSKEDIIGLITALKIFVEEDEVAETARYRKMCESVVDALIEFPGLNVTVEHDQHSYLTPMASIRFTDDWKGPSREEVISTMAKGDPPIFLSHLIGTDMNELVVEPINLSEEELGVVIQRLCQTLS